jgi:hypothetical protein
MAGTNPQLILKAPVAPSWFKQRQGKAEPVTDGHVQRLTAPNLGESLIAISQNESGRWSASLRRKAEGPDEYSTPALFDTPEEAWEAAFELYRTHVVT